MTITVDLTDLSAFTASVKNCNVFTTVPEFWRFKRSHQSSTIQVIMTSQNWNRVNDSSYELSDRELIKHLVRRQAALDEQLSQPFRIAGDSGRGGDRSTSKLRRWSVLEMPQDVAR